MDPKQLKRHVAVPDTHRRLLTAYDGAYSLGIGRVDEHVVLVLQVEPTADQIEFPDSIRLDDETVPVVVERNFIVPEPLSSSR